MSWTPRIDVLNLLNNGPRIQTFDTLSQGPGTISGNIALGCIAEMIGSIVALRTQGQPPRYIQGAGSATPVIPNFATYTQAFDKDTTAGNCLVVWVFVDLTFSLFNVAVTDSQGNEYICVFPNNGHIPGGDVSMTCWVASNAIGGPCTVTVNQTGVSNFDAIAIAVQEYSGPVRVVAQDGWTSLTPFGTNVGITDNVGHGQQATTGGITGTLEPQWEGSTGQVRGDGTVVWTDRGPLDPPVQTSGSAFLVASGHTTVSCVTEDFNELVLFAIGTSPHCPDVQLTGGGSPIPEGWLIINEPGIGSPPTGGGFTNRTPKMFLGEGHQNTFTNQLRQRGQATVHLIIKEGDNYEPVRGSQLFLYDQIDDAFILNFSGLIQNIEHQYVDNGSTHYVIINAVSMESVFDTVLTTLPKQYFEEDAGDIITDLFNTFEDGCPVALGNIEAGAVIHLLNTNFDKISDLFDQLATASEYIWGVDPQTLLLYFQPPDVTPSPFVLTTPNLSETGFGPGFGSINWKQEGNDYRNRQGIRLSPDAFGHSDEFFTGAGQINFTLLRPVDQVVNAWVTLSTQNEGTGAFSSNPSDGDTITISYAKGSGTVTWQPNTIYNIDTIIIDPANHVQKITTAGTSGASQPAWDDKGGTTADNTIIWQDMGPAGLGTGTIFTYVFKNQLDNTQFGQIKIGPDSDTSNANLAAAINSFTGDNKTNGQGIQFSLPTWENAIVNATATGSTLVVKNKAAGTGYVAALSTTSAHFTWSSDFTAGGSSPQGSVGPNEGATISIAVGALGTTIGDPGLAYTTGSADVSLVTPLNVGTNLQVEYTRAGGDVIQVEKTDLVNQLALISHGTGKYQAIVDYSQSLVNATAADGLLLAQQIIEAYSVIPQRVTFDTYQPGLLVGQALTIAITLPTGAVGQINGLWVIEEINAEIESCIETGLCFGIGHYKYTVSVVDIQEIGSYLDFWEGLGGGGSGGGGGNVSALVATSGGSQSATGQALTTGGVNEQSGNYLAVAGDNGKDVVFTATATLTLPAIALSTQWNIFVQNISATDLVTIDPNGLDLDGSGATLIIHPSLGLYITTDGTNYFTQRGAPPIATTIIPGIVQPDGTTIDVDGSGVVSVPTATTSLLGIVKPDGVTIDITAGEISVPKATTGSLGVVEPDGVTIDINGSGVVSVPEATSSTFGIVKPDNVTITIAAGILTSNGLTNPMTTLGDLIAGGTSGVPTRLPIGTDGQVLTARSSATLGVDYESQPYDLVSSLPGLPGSGALVFLFTARMTINFAGNFAGSEGSVGVNPTSTATYTVNKNGSSIGTIVVSTGGVVTFTTTSGTAKSLASGDRMTITAPSPQDATLADVAITIAGTR